eukprot:2735105-Pyramimonas_sp.AAC.1
MALVSPYQYTKKHPVWSPSSSHSFPPTPPPRFPLLLHLPPQRQTDTPGPQNTKEQKTTSRNHGET